MINQISQAIKFPSLKAPASWLPVVFLASIIGFFVLLLFLVLGYQLVFLNRVYPGVTVAGQRVGGLTRSQVMDTVNALTQPQLSRPITLHAGEESWTFTGQQLGMRVDLAATADRVFEVGRRGNLFADMLTHLSLLTNPKNIEPVIAYDTGPTNQVLQELSDVINYPPKNAQIVIQPNGIVDVIADQHGRRLHVGASQPLIEAAIFESQSQDVTVFTQVVLPALATEDVVAVHQQARQLLSRPFEFSFNTQTDSGTWQIPPEKLAQMLSMVEYVDENGKAQLRLELDDSHLAPYFEEFARVIDIIPSNARLYFNDETNQLEVIQHSRDGRKLDVSGAYALTAQAIANGNNSVTLPVKLAPAAISSKDLDALGIEQLVSQSTSYFKGSSEGRMSNIALAASKFDGIIVPPGEIFSFNDHIGPITKEEGFDESLIIYGNRTTVGIGGGVCQVSTTAFRTAFFGGFELVERWAHGYRVGWYETNSQPGLDATIYRPDVDFRFRNDTDHHLLIQTETDLDEGTVTFSFYGTPTDREVIVSEPVIENVVKPDPPLYEPNDELAPGQVKQVDWAKEGMDVTVTRLVKQGESILYQDEILSRYRPWRAVFQVGPGAQVPEATRDQIN